MNMQRKTRRTVFIFASVIFLIAALTAALTFMPFKKESVNDSPTVAARPVLTVAVTSPQTTALTVRVSANGDIMAWQEASIGTEADGLRLIEVLANVGDRVKRGQRLATFASDIIDAELAQSRAMVAEADVALVEAAANAQRARSLQGSGALSVQQIQQYEHAERAAQARLDAAKAVEKTQQSRLAQTLVLAPDDGVISARAAAVGAVVPAGQELFRLIRQGRLEWRAEVAASDLAKLKPGLLAEITPTGGQPIQGRLRMVSPMVDVQTRNGVVYVDLPPDDRVLAGMFARGEFEIEQVQTLTLPQSAILLRDGFSYALRVGPDSRVVQTKLVTGRRTGDRVEIRDGLDASARVVAAGGGFLGDGDLVRVVENHAQSTSAAQPPQGGLL